MKILRESEKKEAMQWFDEAERVAKDSLCLRAHCGAVIVKNGKLVSEGFNSPPQDKPEFRTCLNEYEIPAGFRHDRTCCIHAEQRAIAHALKAGKADDLRGAIMYFVRVDEDGKKIIASDLVCTICSRAVLDVGISGFALYCADGIRVYDAPEFDALSYQYKTPRK